MKKATFALATGYLLGFAGGAATALLTVSLAALAVIDVCKRVEEGKVRITEVAEAVDVIE